MVLPVFFIHSGLGKFLFRGEFPVLAQFDICICFFLGVQFVSGYFLIVLFFLILLVSFHIAVHLFSLPFVIPPILVILPLIIRRKLPLFLLFLLLLRLCEFRVVKIRNYWRWHEISSLLLCLCVHSCDGFIFRIFASIIMTAIFIHLRRVALSGG